MDKFLDYFLSIFIFLWLFLGGVFFMFMIIIILPFVLIEECYSFVKNKLMKKPLN